MLLFKSMLKKTQPTNQTNKQTNKQASKGIISKL